MNLKRDWGDHKCVLGATIRIESYSEAHNYILAVKDVYLDSPAHVSGLQPFKDFILGTREIAFQSLDEFAKYIEVNQGSEVRLYLYNIETQKVREVALTPSKDWGG